MIEYCELEIDESVTVSVTPSGTPKEHFEDAEMGTVKITIRKNEEVTPENE